MGNRFAAIALGIVALAGAARCGGINTLPTHPTAGSAVVVAFGDSLTAGPGLDPSDTYPALLQRRLRQSGYDYRVINAGVSGDTSSEAVRRVDQAIVPDTKIMILELGVNDGLRGMPTNTLEQNLAAITRLAERYRLTLVPFFLIGVVGDPDLTLGDLAHPNAEGHQRIAETIWPYLEPLLTK